MHALKRLLGAKYDFVCSIGCDCGCAGHLIRNRLRLASYPFDWIGTWNIGIIGVAELIANDFSGFLRLEHLQREENPPRGEHDDLRHDYYHDYVVGVDFAHDFPVGCDPAAVLPEIKEKYERRIQRFYKTISSSRHTLLIYWTWRNYPVESEIQKASEVLRARFPKNKVDILVVRHVDGESIAEKFISPGVFVIDAPIHPEGSHPAFGDTEINARIFSKVRLRGKWRILLKERMELAKVRILSAFVLNREHRHAYREVIKKRIERRRIP